MCSTIPLSCARNDTEAFGDAGHVVQDNPQEENEDNRHEKNSTETGPGWTLQHPLFFLLHLHLHLQVLLSKACLTGSFEVKVVGGLPVQQGLLHIPWQRQQVAGIPR